VIGVLDADGQVDIPRMKKIMAAAGRWRSPFIARLICAPTRVRPG
jgi:hypothetical protein